MLVLTSGLDDRFGVGVVRSRIGLSRPAIPVFDDTNILEIYMEASREKEIACVLIDEAQFLKKHHVEELVEIVDSCEFPVMCYGLKNDFRNELFEGSYYLLVYADKIEEIKTICWCGRKANMVARIVDGKFVRTGEQIRSAATICMCLSAESIIMTGESTAAGNGSGAETFGRSVRAHWLRTGHDLSHIKGVLYL